MLPLRVPYPQFHHRRQIDEKAVSISHTTVHFYREGHRTDTVVYLSSIAAHRAAMDWLREAA